MDEKKLAELFKDAVRDTPPPSFGTGEVRRASHRAAQRRRNSIVAGSALAFVLLAGGAVTTVALSGGMNDTAGSSPVAANGAPGDGGGTMYQEGEAPPAPAMPRSEAAQTPQQDTRSGSSKQGDTPPGNAGPSGSTPSGCKADRELAAALAGELPAAANVGAVGVPFGCPPGASGAALRVIDGAKSGTISVVHVPEGVEPGFAPMGSDVPGYVPANAPASTRGGSIYVVSQPDRGTTEAPLGDVVARYAVEIGKKF